MEEHVPFQASSRFGQNFLVDRNILRKIVKQAGITDNDIILEIGPGKGILTRAILDAGCKKLYAVELDRRLEPFLAKLNVLFPNLVIFWEDALKLDYPERLRDLPDKVIANIPYNITTPLIWRMLETLAPRGMKYLLLMVQRESAERLFAVSGSKHRYPLGITIEAMGFSRKIFNVPPGAFRPVPKVESAVIEIVLERECHLATSPSWRNLLRESFAQRRKTLLNNLARKGLPFDKREISEAMQNCALPANIRAEELTTEEWLNLHRELQKGR
ncbi:MAG: ribosomal RNA small subunit methyltransferase A [Synergistales bacterium]|nr:ribosomal RNA small subunit methyltransferase A [Synergistales bacterium]